MNEDRMTPEALAEIEGKAKKCADNKLPAFALVYSTERELALDAVPQMAAEIRRAWAENTSLRAELEAITKQINRVRSCKMCAHHKSDVFENPCAVCNMIVKQNFEWARPCPANTPAQGATDETRGGGEG